MACPPHWSVPATAPKSKSAANDTLMSRGTREARRGRGSVCGKGKARLQAQRPRGYGRCARNQRLGRHDRTKRQGRGKLWWRRWLLGIGVQNRGTCVCLPFSDRRRCARLVFLYNPRTCSLSLLFLHHSCSSSFWCSGKHRSCLCTV